MGLELEYMCGFVLISPCVLYCSGRAQLAHLQAGLMYLVLHLSACIFLQREGFRKEREPLLH